MKDQEDMPQWPEAVRAVREQLDSTGLLAARSFDVWGRAWRLAHGLPCDCREWPAQAWLAFGVACGRLIRQQETAKGKGPDFGLPSQAKDPPPDR